jgi:predicted glycosyltransferase/nucleoside-diphosphate-sugar epimerase
VAGFVGSHLAERLIALGHEVVGIDSFTSYYSPALKRRNIAGLRDHPCFHLVEDDLNTVELDPLVESAEWVFHLAGQPGVRDSWGAQFGTYVRNNIEATQRLLEALRAHRPQRVVYASSSSVYGDAPLPMDEDARPQPLSPYGVTKLAAEHLMRGYWNCYGLPIACLRFFTVYGPRQRPDMAFNRFIRAIARGEPIQLYGDGTQTRDFTYVADVVEGCVAAAAADCAGQVINIGGGSSCAVADVLALLGDLIGRPVRIERQAGQRGDAPHTSASTVRARELLGWHPATRLVDGLRHQAIWQLGAAALRASGAVVPPRRGEHAGPRLLLYGHDTYGLGHLRRNLTLADGLTREFPDLSILLLTGSPAAQHFALPANVDYVKLPSVVKVADEDYQAQTLHLQAGEIARLRSALIREAVSGFAPDAILVDHAPAGMKGELLPALEELRHVNPHARVALGLRDIVDEPEVVRRNWTERGIYDILDSFYDAILVYGVPPVMDVIVAYRLPAAVAAKSRYCGYLPRAQSPTDPMAVRSAYCTGDEHLVDEHLVLVTAGGGGDGYRLLSTYLLAVSEGGIPSPTASVIVTGPFMAARERAELDAVAAGQPHVRLLTFTDDMLGLMQAADVVVCMGGYNTICEVLSAGVPAIVVPRVAPRREQLLRARAFAELGLVATLPPDMLTPAALGDQVTRLLRATTAEQPGVADGARSEMASARERFIASGALDGLNATVRAVGELLREATTASSFVG